MLTPFFAAVRFAPGRMLAMYADQLANPAGTGRRFRRDVRATRLRAELRAARRCFGGFVRKIIFFILHPRL
jgi:hypothetical protein